MKHYKHLFFDLDRTLWDFETNSDETLNDILIKYDLASKGITSLKMFKGVYSGINTMLWNLYLNGEIIKEKLNTQRFNLTLEAFGITDTLLANSMADDYVEMSPLKTNLFPFAMEMLEYLHGQYKLHIITNGFEEVQFKKLERTGMGRYFNQVITSEEAGAMKPNEQIFLFALNKACALASESLMIGDEIEIDLLGAKSVGLDQMYVNHHGKIHKESFTFEVMSLSEIMEIL
ncbi:MAG: YjjG family noncanonical pyrimidine nucleotidase [Bacteroidales bacterium]